MRCRLLRWEVHSIDAKLLEKMIRQFIARRFLWMSADTDAYRLVNAKGDGLPGRVVDRYGEVLVVQISNAGMEQLKSVLIAQD